MRTRTKKTPKTPPVHPVKLAAAEAAQRLADGLDVTVRLEDGTLEPVAQESVRRLLEAGVELRVIPRKVYDAHVALCVCHGKLLQAVRKSGRTWTMTYYVEGRPWGTR